MYTSVRVGQATSLAHDVAREALKVHAGFSPRWIKSETKIFKHGNGVLVRIRAQVVLVPGKPDGTWVKISTTLRRMNALHAYFPGPTVKVDSYQREEVYGVRSIEGAYRHLEGFVIQN